MPPEKAAAGTSAEEDPFELPWLERCINTEPSEMTKVAGCPLDGFPGSLTESSQELEEPSINIFLTSFVQGRPGGDPEAGPTQGENVTSPAVAELNSNVKGS